MKLLYYLKSGSCEVFDLVGHQDLVLLILEQVQSFDILHDQAGGELRAERFMQMGKHGMGS